MSIKFNLILLRLDSSKLDTQFIKLITQRKIQNIRLKDDAQLLQLAFDIAM